MAITIDGKIFRNIQEQVEKNKRDIAAWTDIQFTLNNFGITVLGRVDAEADIPEATYEYGDAYLVGEEDPYDIYIFTRDGADGEFINMGPLTVVGPEGPIGPQGPAATITIGSVTTGEPGTSVIVTNSGTSDNAVLNFTIPKGATGATGSQGEQGIQGIQGEQGIQGDPGESFMIIGTITNTSQLPDPSTTQRNYAYVYDDGDATTPNRLYYITGTEGNEQWSYSSLAAAGTTVSVSGNPVSTWSADTKLNAPSTAGTDGDVLTLASGVPTWSAPSGGGGEITKTTRSTSFQDLARLIYKNPNILYAKSNASISGSAGYNAGDTLGIQKTTTVTSGTGTTTFTQITSSQSIVSGYIAVKPVYVHSKCALFIIDESHPETKTIIEVSSGTATTGDVFYQSKTLNSYPADVTETEITYYKGGAGLNATFGSSTKSWDIYHIGALS